MADGEAPVSVCVHWLRLKRQQNHSDACHRAAETYLATLQAMSARIGSYTGLIFSLLLSALVLFLSTGCGTSATNSDPAPASAVPAPSPQAASAYLTWKNNVSRTGLQPQELTLTPANVNDAQFGEKFSAPLDGWAYAQPLYVGGLTIGGAAHNVVFMATENDSVYAFDADTPGPPLWHKNFLGPGITTVPPLNNDYLVIADGIGITATPVIDRARRTIYVLAQTVENGVYANKLHALDLVSGDERPGSPVTLSAPNYDARLELSRSALLLSNRTIYIAFAAYPPDLQPYSGWVFAVDAPTLTQVASWSDTEPGGQGGIWMAGSAPVADESGNIYLTSGNGAWNGTTDLAMSAVKLDPMLQVLDYFTPYDALELAASDYDLGSGGILMIPGRFGAVGHEAVICGKPHQIYVVNLDHMGHKGATADEGVIQEVSYPSRLPDDATCYTTPAFFNGTVYLVGNNDGIKAFSLDPGSGKLSLTPASQSSFRFMFPGAQPVVSASGTANGIVWAVDNTPGVGSLHAFDASDVSREIYRSPCINPTKWSVPTVIDGKVYVATKTDLVVFGLK